MKRDMLTVHHNNGMATILPIRDRDHGPVESCFDLAEMYLVTMVNHKGRFVDSQEFDTVTSAVTGALGMLDNIGERK